jgi:hypothetical protein
MENLYLTNMAMTCRYKIKGKNGRKRIEMIEQTAVTVCSITPIMVRMEVLARGQIGKVNLS